MKVSESKCVNSCVFEFFVSFPNVETKKNISDSPESFERQDEKISQCTEKKDSFLTSKGSTKVSRRDARYATPRKKAMFQFYAETDKQEWYMSTFIFYGTSFLSLLFRLLQSMIQDHNSRCEARNGDRIKRWIFRGFTPNLWPCHFSQLRGSDKGRKKSRDTKRESFRCICRSNMITIGDTM